MNEEHFSYSWLATSGGGIDRIIEKLIEIRPVSTIPLQ